MKGTNSDTNTNTNKVLHNSSVKQPKEYHSQTKATCKQKVIDNSEVCIGVFFVCLFVCFPFCILWSCHLAI